MSFQDVLLSERFRTHYRFRVSTLLSILALAMNIAVMLYLESHELDYTRSYAPRFKDNSHDALTSPRRQYVALFKDAYVLFSTISTGNSSYLEHFFPE